MLLRGHVHPDSGHTAIHIMVATTKVCILLVATAILFACSSAGRNFASQQDELRKRNLELELRIKSLNKQIEQHLKNQAILHEQVSGQASKMTGVEVPQLNRIKFGRYSGALDTDKDNTCDVIRIYVLALDQDGRFIPVAGRAVIRASQITADGKIQSLGERLYDAPMLANSYRSGITGTHYTLELPLSSIAPPNESTRAIVTVLVHDAGTGLTKQHDQMITLQNSPRIMAVEPDR